MSFWMCVSLFSIWIHLFRLHNDSKTRQLIAIHSQFTVSGVRSYSHFFLLFCRAFMSELNKYSKVPMLSTTCESMPLPIHGTVKTKQFVKKSKILFFCCWLLLDELFFRLLKCLYVFLLGKNSFVTGCVYFDLFFSIYCLSSISSTHSRLWSMGMNEKYATQ